MGVILVNMISGRNPWRYATVDDQCYQAFLNDNNFLGNVLPISAEANMIIKRIFTIDPLRRISLEKLKEEIIQVRTFFKSPRQLKPPSRPLQAEKPLIRAGRPSPNLFRPNQIGLWWRQKEARYLVLSSNLLLHAIPVLDL